MGHFTPDQTTAITTRDKNMVVAAGAGSGKTRVLVERYLHVLLANGWRLNDLVAITFTRAAAAEMRERIRLALEERLREAQADSAEQAHYAELLSQMDSARISTIHSLCGDILRANAARIGLDPAFEVIEGVDVTLLQEDAIQMALRDFAERDETSAEHEALRELYETYNAYQIEKTLQTVIHAILPDEMPHPAEILAQWDVMWTEAVVELSGALRDWLARFMAYAPADDKELSNYIHQAQAYYRALSQGTGDVMAIALALVGEKRPRSTKAWDEAEFQAIRGHVDALKAGLEAFFSTWAGGKKPKTSPTPPSEDVRQRRAAELVPAWYRLIRAVQERYEGAKRQMNRLDYDDLEHLTVALLQHADVRDRYRLGEFKHLLVDEFQDTNQAQWDIISALADVEKGGKVFIVGDLKQSIYAFRGADVSVFKRVRDDIVRHQHGQGVDLRRSFRSHERLIDFFNAFFKMYMQIEGDENWHIGYDKPLEAHRQTSLAETPVEVILVSQYPEGKEQAKVSNEVVKQAEAYAIAQAIKDMVAREMLVHDKDGDGLRPVRYGDIAVLFRAMTNVHYYETALTALGIPYVTTSGRGYYQQQELWDVLNLLKALHNHADNLALASALHSPLFNISDEGLYILRRHTPDSPDTSLWAQLFTQGANPSESLSLADRLAIERACRILAYLARLSGRVRIGELLRIAVSETGYLATLQLLPEGVRRRRNIEKLIQIAETSQHVMLGDFTRHLETLTLAETREGEASLETGDAVQLMTIHGSKGLEFPVVCVVQTHATGQKGGHSAQVSIVGGSIAPHIYDAEQRKTIGCAISELHQAQHDDRQRAEDKRLFYVATTRARDKLLISGALTDKNAKPKHWLGAVLGWLDYTVSQDDPPTTPEGERVTSDGVEVAIHRPLYDAEALREAFTQGDDTLHAMPSAGVAPVAPALMGVIEVTPTQQVTHLAASELATLGGYRMSQTDEERQHYHERLRHRLLTDEAPQLIPAQRTASPRVTMRVIGDIVHEALRYWQFPHNTPNLASILAGYAWQFHIVSQAQRDQAVDKSLMLLEHFQHSALYEQIEAIHRTKGRIYRELPFVYNTGKRIVHGVIDVLFESAPNVWHLVDYKTSAMPSFSTSNAVTHARRYHLQVGVYAAATLRELGDVSLEVAVHYLRYQHTVMIPTTVWQEALTQLEGIIGEIVATP